MAMPACVEARVTQPKQRFARTITPDPRLVASVRRDITAELYRWDADTLVDDMQILVSEVLTNAIQHAADTKDVTIVATWTRPVLRIEVYDGSRVALPKAILPDPATSDRGRGLPLIDALSSAWGWSPAQPDGKCVWFEIRDVVASRTASCPRAS